MPMALACLSLVLDGITTSEPAGTFKTLRRVGQAMTETESVGAARGFAGALRRYWRRVSLGRRLLWPAYALLLGALMLATVVVWGLLFAFEAAGVQAIEFEPIRIS